MIERIAKYTNREGQGVRGEQWRHTDATEIEGLIGYLLHMGALRDNITPTTILWSKTVDNPLIMACFSRDRFLKLSNHLRFDDKETRSQKREKDALALLRDLELSTSPGQEYDPCWKSKEEQTLFATRVSNWTRTKEGRCHLQLPKENHNGCV